MRTTTVIIFCILQCYVLLGCNVRETNIQTKNEVSFWEEKTLDACDGLIFNLDCDSVNAEIFGWDKNKVKFEIIKRLRGSIKRDILERKLDNFNIDIKNSGNIMTFKSRYREFASDIDMKVIDLRVYLPKKLHDFNFVADLGNFKFIDDLNCDFKGKGNNVNLSINRFLGKLSFEAASGNVKILNAKLIKGSFAKLGSGNITLMGEFEPDGTYLLETGKGNIDVALPEEAPIRIENFGILDTNEFQDNFYPSVLSLKSNIGKNTIRKLKKL